MTAATRLTGAGNLFEVISGSATSLSFNKTDLANLAVGDLLLVAFTFQTAADATTTVTVPSGFSRLGPALPTVAPFPRIGGLYAYPITDAAALTALSATMTFSHNKTAGRAALQASRITGAKLTGLPDAQGAAVITSVAGATIAVPTVSSTVADCLIVGYVAIATASPTPVAAISTDLSGSSAVATSSPATGTASTTGVGTFVAAKAAIGATGTVTVTDTTGSFSSVSGGYMISLAPASAPAATGIPGNVINSAGAIQAATWFTVDATDHLANPLSIFAMPEGYKTINTMLAKTPFYIGHRGGSASYPEMSMHAYTQAVRLGYGALEVSCARSSDGVWFGLHDASLDRTSLQTGGGTGTTLVASTMTWAQIQAYQISAWETNNTSQPAQPYMRLVDLFAAYPTHVFLLDPKAAIGYITELLNLVEATFPNPQAKVIVKYYGVGTSSWATLGHSRGYTTWGYFYEGDDIATYQAQWDILGLNVEATQAAWTSIKAYGKKVIGHTPATQAAATLGLSKGADGLMVAGTSLVAVT